MIEKGASKQDVVRVMGEPTRVGRAPTPYWDREELDGAEVKRITSSIDYTVSTFVLPITFRFSFDEQGMLVGKHRYD
jgi:hypothetical protein